MKFSGKVWTVEWPQDDLIKFRVNPGKWVGESKVNLLSPTHRTTAAIWFDCCLLAVLGYHLATENVMKLLFLAFCYIATRSHGGGVCCASHHSLFVNTLRRLLLDFLTSPRNPRTSRSPFMLLYASSFWHLHSTEPQNGQGRSQKFVLGV